MVILTVTHFLKLIRQYWAIALIFNISLPQLLNPVEDWPFQVSHSHPKEKN